MVFHFFGCFVDQSIHPARLSLRFVIMTAHIHSAAVSVHRMIAEGCQTSKFKVGRDSAKSDVVRVRAVRRAAEPDPCIPDDANGARNVNKAIQALHSPEELDIASVEQPVNRLDLDDMARVRGKTLLPSRQTNQS